MIEVRNLHFALEGKVPRHWHGGRRGVTAFFDNLSVFFPAGERFFIAAVRSQRHHVKDPALADAVRDFCAQEGVHGREHIAYNALLRSQGYPVDRLEKRVKLVLAVVTRVLPRRMQLAATCALEHFTALMGHLLLDDARRLGDAHPAMAALWRWHAAEENEHKSVAYDVYRAAGGNYAERAGIMVAATGIFWTLVVAHQAEMMAVDGLAFSPREWRALYRFLFVDPGGMQHLVRLYFAYFRPGFHPRDIDSDELLARWKREFARMDVYRDAAA